MIKEERVMQEAAKRARMDGSPDVGGVTLPLSRKALLRGFWLFTLLYPAYMLITAQKYLNEESIFAGTILFVSSILPSWFWSTGRVQGLPVFPIFALLFLPTYVAPLWQGHVELKNYTITQQNTAVWTVSGFLLIATLFWQQTAVKKVNISKTIRMINLTKSQGILLFCLLTEVVFELIQSLFWEFGAGGLSAVRGFASAAGKMGVFVLSYQLGQNKLDQKTKISFLVLVSILLVQEISSLLLTNVIPTLGIAIAAFCLGSGKIPWKTLFLCILGIYVLQAGKAEIRTKYWEKPKPSVTEIGNLITEWISLGLKNLKMDSSESEIKSVSSAAERASLLQVMMKVQKDTPGKVPFLGGETYTFIPSLLVPRIINPDKTFSHLANMILALRYGILTEESVFKVSIAFDPIIEAYANFGLLGVIILGIVLGFFFGGVSRITINTPMLSFGFIFGIQVISASLSSFNTTGVFITSIWQSFLALLGLSFCLMEKTPNPLYVTAERIVECGRLGVKEKVAGGHKGQTENAAQVEAQAEVTPVRHERPTRFVYRKKKGK